MKTLYVEKVDKHKFSFKKFKIDNDNLYIYVDIENTRNVNKIVKKILKSRTTNVVLSKELLEYDNFKNCLIANNINIFNGRWLEKYLTINILDYVVKLKNEQKEMIEIAVTVNQITDSTIEIIKILSKQYKRLTVVSNHIDKLRKLEKEIFDKEGILITLSNNMKKSLLKPQIILNMDFSKEILNKYSINENAIIINLEGMVKVEGKRFNGICVNDYEIEVGKEDTIWRSNIKVFREKDLLEAAMYMKDTYYNICNKINKNKISIKELYGVNGKIERFS